MQTWQGILMGENQLRLTYLLLEQGSTTKAEYFTAKGGKHMLWMKRFASELGLNKIFRNSQITIDLSKNSMYHSRMKHVLM